MPFVQLFNFTFILRFFLLAWFFFHPEIRLAKERDGNKLLTHHYHDDRHVEKEIVENKKKKFLKPDSLSYSPGFEWEI